LYDLIATSNHFGNTYGGHYTAYAFNDLLKKWLFYNDSKVGYVKEEDIIDPAAYVLFYRRRRPENYSQ
jgi:ubiquitin C-terminal hydrolase